MSCDWNELKQKKRIQKLVAGECENSGDKENIEQTSCAILTRTQQQQPSRNADFGLSPFSLYPFLSSLRRDGTNGQQNQQCNV